MSKWITPSQASPSQTDRSQSDSPQSEPGRSDRVGSNDDTAEVTLALADPRIDDLGGLAPPTSSDGYYDNSSTNAVHYGSDHGTDLSFEAPAADRSSIVGVVLAAGAVALLIAIVLAMVLRHDGVVNRERLFPDLEASAETVGAVIDPDYGIAALLDSPTSFNSDKDAS